MGWCKVCKQTQLKDRTMLTLGLLVLVRMLLLRMLLRPMLLPPLLTLLQTSGLMQMLLPPLPPLMVAMVAGMVIVLVQMAVVTMQWVAGRQ
jgi:hypothetical protein